ncbi:MAG: hypothetical protein IT342_01950 [Candidatus Melainabacteria bacterium]|nr:hypothetical protein [Candidatus Melainabacteria bacterium]
MKHGFLLLFLLLAFSCLSVCADEPDKAKDEILNKWKASITTEIREEVDRRYTAISNRYTGCTVAFNINRDGSVTDIHVSHCENSLFAGMVYAVVSRFKGNALLKFPEEVKENDIKFDFAVISNQYPRIGDFDSTRHKKIPYVDGKRVPSK